MRLDGKVAVITSVASGMGLASTTRFAVEGASIVAGNWNAKRLDPEAAVIKTTGGAIVSAQGTIAGRETAATPIELVLTDHGRLDMPCNNAGVMDSLQGAGELEDKIGRRVFGINLDGPMFTSRRAVQPMRQPGSGPIITIASIGGLQGGEAGTPTIGATMPAERLDPFGAARAGAYAALLPAALEPVDTGALPLYLASDASRRINGAVITAGAGRSAE